MYRSSDCAQRRAPAADSCEILHLLQWMASSCFARKGCAGRAPDRPLRGHRRTCNLGRIASPVRTYLVFGSDTELLKDFDEEFVRTMLAKVPRGRFVLVEEIAAMVAFCSSTECSFTTGGVFDISGGRATY